ncbi:MFS transporter [Neobacillus vireti]|uniref:MFS transporter n=1 Tax=Neobacillus vireti TaxID=220686 RepID=UPI002FFDA4D6
MGKAALTAVENKPKIYYGYFIVVLSFIAMFATLGIRGTFGTYVTPWEESFSVNRLWVSIVSFTSLFIYGISIAIAGRLADRIGPRKVLTYSMVLMSFCLLGSYFATNIWHIVILYGLIGSVGFGFASNITVSVAIVRWFKEKKGLMISIVVVGMAAGPMVYTPLNILLIEKMGWKWLFVLYGSVYALLLIPLFALFFKDHPVQNAVIERNKSKQNEKIKGESIFSIFRYPITWVICMTYFICGFTDVGLVYTHMVPLGEGKGYSRILVGNAMMVYGIANIVGTIIVGYISDKFNNKKLLCILFSIRVIALLFLLFINHPILLFTFALLYGFTDIATIAPFTMLCSKIFGINRMGSAFGMVSFFHQFGAAFGSLIPGLLFSLSLDYISTLWLCIILLLASAILIQTINMKQILD